MTRKDFELIAATIRRLDLEFVAPDARVRRVAQLFARELKETNTRFDAERFLKACGE